MSSSNWIRAEGPQWDHIDVRSHDDPNGGSFNSSFNVFVQIRLEEVGGPGQAVFTADFFMETNPTTPQTFSHLSTPGYVNPDPGFNENLGPLGVDVGGNGLLLTPFGPLPAPVFHNTRFATPLPSAVWMALPLLFAAAIIHKSRAG